MRSSLFTTFSLVIVSYLLILGIPSLGSIGKYPIKNFPPEEYKAGIQNIDFAPTILELAGGEFALA